MLNIVQSVDSCQRSTFDTLEAGQLFYFVEEKLHNVRIMTDESHHVELHDGTACSNADVEGSDEVILVDFPIILTPE